MADIKVVDNAVNERLLTKIVELKTHRDILHDDCEAFRTTIERYRTERDEARKWARNLLARCELEHWITMRAASWQRDDEMLIASLQAENVVLKARLAAMFDAGRMDVEV